ncbi:MAG: ParB/RepB/Spo0J family partition protein [Clostridia bacterium]|nr:ParB/RepB/Spo0J family partition protein [Clostridia bacterium]
MERTYENAGRIINIPVDTIKPNPYQPRKFIDATSVSSLADSIRRFGLLQPITVRRLKENTYELVSGERRLRAAQMAGADAIPAIIVDISDNDCAFFVLTENIQRKQLDFFEESEALLRLCEQHGFSPEEISGRTGLRPSAVASKMKLARLSPTVKRIVYENKLSEEHAAALLRLADDNTRLDVIKRIIEKEYTPADTEQYISERLNSEISKRKKVVCMPRGNIRDYKIVLNTVNKALDLAKSAGVSTETEQSEHDGFYEYVIKINKSK